MYIASMWLIKMIMQHYLMQSHHLMSQPQTMMGHATCEEAVSFNEIAS